MIEEGRGAEADVAAVVRLRRSGERATGAYRCADCGYGVALAAALPACPMCGGTVWEEAAPSPSGRAGGAL